MYGKTFVLPFILISVMFFKQNLKMNQEQSVPINFENSKDHLENNDKGEESSLPLALSAESCGKQQRRGASSTVFGVRSPGARPPAALPSWEEALGPPQPCPPPYQGSRKPSCSYFITSDPTLPLVCFYNCSLCEAISRGFTCYRWPYRLYRLIFKSTSHSGVIIFSNLSLRAQLPQLTSQPGLCQDAAVPAVGHLPSRAAFQNSPFHELFKIQLKIDPSPFLIDFHSFLPGVLTL